MIYRLTGNHDGESWSSSKVTHINSNDDNNNSNIHDDKLVSMSTTFDRLPLLSRVFQTTRSIVLHFLPANYPSSVAPGYGRFAAFGFCASVAGSAAMVLSTQTLLLAVGIVGHHDNTNQSHVSASILAGALNWVLKDGIGQLGGVWFASYMGRTASQFDASPKYWRMVAAFALDSATLLEITSPMFPSTWVLAVASIANIGKNIGFLTASASRAALHQSLAKVGNLGDVTAKAGSQSMAASVFGTALGIGLSPVLGDVPHFVMGFLGLSCIHLGCNYLALKAVPLSHFDRHRLHILMHAHFKEGGVILDPSQVASQESFLPFVVPDDSHAWLSLGSTIPELGGPAAVQELIDPEQSYVLTANDGRIHLVFYNETTSLDMMQGIHHAYWLHYYGSDRDVGKRKVEFQTFWTHLHDKGWNVELLRIEPPKAVRISVK